MDFPHALRFSYFPHRIEVDDSPHNLMWLVLIVLMWFFLYIQDFFFDQKKFSQILIKNPRMESHSEWLNISESVATLLRVYNICIHLWKMRVNFIGIVDRDVQRETI